MSADTTKRHVDWTGTTPSGKTPDEWAGPASQVGEFARSLSKRGDIATQMGPETTAAMVGTACWVPTTAELSIHTPNILAGVKPEEVDLDDELFRLKQAQFIGAVVHESAHAAFSCVVPIDYSRWEDKDGDKFDKREVDVAMILEESRIEKMVGDARPTFRPFLRNMALEIVLKDFKIADTEYGASMSAALTLARVDAGVLTEENDDKFRPIIREKLSEDQVATLTRLWREYQNISVTVDQVEKGRASWPFEQVLRIAREWIETVHDPDDEGSAGGAGDRMDDLSGAAEGEGDPGEGEGEAAEGEGSMAGKVKDAAREALVDDDTELAERRRVVTQTRRRMEVTEDGKRKVEGAKESKKMAVDGAHGMGESTGGGRIVHRRPPLPDERAAAARLAKQLLKIDYTDRIITKHSSALPPGRASGRGLVHRAAERAGNRPVTAEPFKAKRKKVVNNDQLRVAVLTDVSGSMGAAAEPEAIMNYVFATAIKKIDGGYYSALFGHTVELMVGTRTPVDHVAIPAVVDGSEQIKPALLAADYELDLLNGSGPRLIVILTDAHFVDGRMQEYSKTFMALCKQRGVAVVWGHWGAFHTNYGHGRVANMAGKTPVEATEAIGSEIVKALTASRGSV